jgi:hypothetical protein
VSSEQISFVRTKSPSNIISLPSGKLSFDTYVGIRNVNREIPLSIERIAFPQGCVSTDQSDPYGQRQHCKKVTARGSTDRRTGSFLMQSKFYPGVERGPFRSFDIPQGPVGQRPICNPQSRISFFHLTVWDR